MIRYTNSEYIDSYKNGELYLSSLSKFWDLKTYRIMYDDLVTGGITQEEIEALEQAQKMMQQDYSEGVGSQVPRNIKTSIFPSNIQDKIIHDIRFRTEAYGYCNLLCFYRVDVEDVNGNVSCDEDNLPYLLAKKGFNLSSEQIKAMNPIEVHQLLDNIISKNFVLSPEQCHVIQLPNRQMDSYGDAVILIKDEKEFVRRVLNAVKEEGGECITGDVRYHKMIDRVSPDDVGKKHHVTLISDSLFDINELVKGDNSSLSYGCLDKYDCFKEQKEWRICWLPSEKNTEDKILSVGRLDDLVDVIPRENIRDELLRRNPGYVPGYTNYERKKSYGTVSYGQFKKIVENIDGKCRLIFEIGR